MNSCIYKKLTPRYPRLTEGLIHWSKLERCVAFLISVVITTRVNVLDYIYSTFTFFLIAGLAPAARRSSTTIWWPWKLAVYRGVTRSYVQ